MAVLGAIVPHFIIGIALGAGLYGFFMLCQGFFQIKSDIPPWFIWVYYMGFHTYSFRAAGLYITQSINQSNDNVSSDT